MTITEIELEEGCTRAHQSACEGETFLRTSRSGLTVAPICEGHAAELERDLDAVAERYPEVNHPEFCDCHGCRDAW